MNRITLFFLSIVAVLFVGCVASGPMGFKDLPAKAGFGQIYVFRESKFAAAGISSDIYVDGAKIGALPNGSFLVVYAPVGKHKIEARFSMINKMWYKDAAIEVVTAEGQSFFRFDLSLTSLTVGAYSDSTWDTGFVAVPPDQAHHVIDSLKLNNTVFDVVPDGKASN